MSWLTGLANKAEDFLNKVDQTAAGALHQHTPIASGGAQLSRQRPQAPDVTLVAKTSLTNPPPSSRAVSSDNNTTSSSSGVGHRTEISTPDTTPPPTAPSHEVTAANNRFQTRKKRTNEDDKLFEFLNSGSTTTSTEPATTQTTSPVVEKKHPRQSSSPSSSTASVKIVKSFEDTPTTTTSIRPPGADVTHNIAVKPGAETDEGKCPDVTDLGQVSENTTPDIISLDSDKLNLLTDVSTGRPSVTDTGVSDPVTETTTTTTTTTDNNQMSSSVELENKLLRSEIESLNYEMGLLVQRTKHTSDELNNARQQIEDMSDQLSREDQLLRQLRGREDDLSETLAAKDSQLAILRVRLQEADQAVKAKDESISHLQYEKERIRKDHSDSSEIHNHSLESIKQKVADSEHVAELERQSFSAEKSELQTRVWRLEEDYRQLADSTRDVQKYNADERLLNVELQTQLRSIQALSNTAKQDLSEYKQKASRILQSKDKIITSLKEGIVDFDGEGVSAVELEETKHERDLLKDELQNAAFKIETMQLQVQELDAQLQADSEMYQEQLKSIQEQLNSEQKVKFQMETDLSQKSQEMSYLQTELQRHKILLMSSNSEKDEEIHKLRHQLAVKSASSTSETELEHRIRSLTESLIQKQTIVESLSTEKNSLALQLERIEQQHKKVITVPLQASVSHHHPDQSLTIPSEEQQTDFDPVRYRSVFRVSPFDSGVSKGVKKAANVIDRFSIRLGVFLRRYPIARLFVIVYMAMLHLWVTIVLLTYKPEIHPEDFHPQP